MENIQNRGNVLLTETEFRLLLAEACEAAGAHVDENEISKFLLYKDLLVSWNNKINLTSITDESQIIYKHFADSLTALPYLRSNASVIDVGTGAGFPGIPLKIVNDAVSLTLLDSLKKRTVFLEDVRDKLGLDDVCIICGRAEDLGRDFHLREKFDVAVSRAVAPLTVLAEYCLPFVKVGGVFLAMKGGGAEQEAEEARYAIETFGGEIKSVNCFLLADNSRTIIEIAKMADTPSKYPRRAGIPSKRPLSKNVIKK